MKTIGVIGGLGPQATMDFEARLHAVAQRLIPQQHNTGYPPLIVAYVREVPMVFDTLDHAHAAPALIDAAQKIGPLVDVLVMTSNTPHLFQAEIERVAGTKIMSMIDVTIDEVLRRGWRTAGVVAVGFTLAQRLYQRRLEDHGIRAVAIEEPLISALDHAIWHLMEGRQPEGAHPAAQQSIAFLRAQSVDGIILGCTEVPLLLRSEAEAADLINPAQLLAEAAIRYAID
jgi:aspartate racemase